MWPNDPFVNFVLRLGRAIGRFEQFVIHGMFFLGDILFALLLCAVDGLCWLGRKLLGYCEPECNEAFNRVDGAGDDPQTTRWQCRKCGRIHEQRGDDARW